MKIKITSLALILMPVTLLCTKHYFIKSQPPNTKTNIVFILTDNLGYCEVGVCQY